MIEVKVPDIGDFDDVEVIEIMVAIGDHVAVDDSIITVESDKASMEIPCSHQGIIKAIKCALGDKVSEGSLILELEETVSSNEAVPSVVDEEKTEPVVETAAAVEKAPTTAAPQSNTTNKPSPTAMINAQKFVLAHASPAVRKFARELGADLSQMQGSGRSGRILKEDVQNFVKNALSQKSATSSASSTLGIEAMPEIDFSQWGEIDNITLSKINVLTGKFLHRNWLNIPHVTQFDDADITDMEDFRKATNIERAQDGIKLTLLPFLLKAVVKTLQKHPRFNTSLSVDGQSLIQKYYFHIGVAVATPDGLVVPVIRDVDQKSLSELSIELAELAKKARDKKLTPREMQGGCFTISSLGGIGGTKFTPIVNAPEVAILGVSRAKMAPVWNGNEFQPRLMCPLALSYDHRVIDGAQGAAFTNYLTQILGDIRQLLI